MKKTNFVLRFSAILLMLISFLFSTSNIAVADEKPAEDAIEKVADADSEKKDGGEEAGDDEKKAEGDKDKKKKKGDEEEEPECE